LAPGGRQAIDFTVQSSATKRLIPLCTTPIDGILEKTHKPTTNQRRNSMAILSNGKAKTNDKLEQSTELAAMQEDGQSDSCRQITRDA
jgi:hypothetical protein